jgi:hypothetical protein
MVLEVNGVGGIGGRLDCCSVCLGTWTPKQDRSRKTKNVTRKLNWKQKQPARRIALGYALDLAKYCNCNNIEHCVNVCIYVCMYVCMYSLSFLLSGARGERETFSCHCLYIEHSITAITKGIYMYRSILTILMKLNEGSLCTRLHTMMGYLHFCQLQLISSIYIHN